MSQHDMIIDNAAGASVRADINLALQALASCSCGPSEPVTKYEFMLWADTSSGMMKQRNAGNTAWIDLFKLSTGLPALLDVGSLLGGIAAGTTAMSGRQKLINGNFGVNQLVKSGTVSLSSGAYGHDGFKAGAGGCTYTFSTANGLTTLTISVGTLIQIANGKYLQSGTHIIGYDGTAPCRINGGAWGASGMTNSVTGGANQTIEWGVGTLSLPQYEPGSVRTKFEFHDDELRRCQRYFRKSYAQSVVIGSASSAGERAAVSVGTAIGGTVFCIEFETMDSFPTLQTYSPFNGAAGYAYDSTAGANRAVSYVDVSDSSAVIQNAISTTAGVVHTLHYTLSARL